jgi:hypothetical protein
MGFARNDAVWLAVAGIAAFVPQGVSPGCCTGGRRGRLVVIFPGADNSLRTQNLAKTFEKPGYPFWIETPSLPRFFRVKKFRKTERNCDTNERTTQ